MKRRELLAGGVSLGLALVNDALVEREAAAAGNPDTPRFFQGLLSGGPIAEWGLLVSIRGRVVTGFSQAPGQPGGQGKDLAALNLRGRLLGSNRVSGELFDIQDRGFQHPLGTLAGRLVRGVVAGQFDLDAGAGEFMASRVETDPRAARPFAGNYHGQLRDPSGRALFNLESKVSANAAWVIRNITPTNGKPPIAGIFTGFGATNRDRTDGYGFSNNDFAGCLCAIPTAASGQAMGDLSGFSFSTTYLGSDLVLNLQRAR